jgi:hypothetical protein
LLGLSGAALLPKRAIQVELMLLWNVFNLYYCVIFLYQLISWLLLLFNFNFPSCDYLHVQFGTRIARESNKKVFGSNRAANQASAGSVDIHPHVE